MGKLSGCNGKLGTVFQTHVEHGNNMQQLDSRLLSFWTDTVIEFKEESPLATFLKPKYCIILISN